MAVSVEDKNRIQVTFRRRFVAGRRRRRCRDLRREDEVDGRLAERRFERHRRVAQELAVVASGLVARR